MSKRRGIRRRRKKRARRREFRKVSINKLQNYDVIVMYRQLKGNFGF